MIFFAPSHLTNTSNSNFFRLVWFVVDFLLYLFLIFLLSFKIFIFCACFVNLNSNWFSCLLLCSRFAKLFFSFIPSSICRSSRKSRRWGPPGACRMCVPACAPDRETNKKSREREFEEFIDWSPSLKRELCCPAEWIINQFSATHFASSFPPPHPSPAWDNAMWRLTFWKEWLIRTVSSLELKSD